MLHGNGYTLKFTHKGQGAFEVWELAVAAVTAEEPLRVEFVEVVTLVAVQ